MEQIAVLLRKRTNRYNKGTPEYYSPLDPEDSKTICAYFRKHIYLPLDGNNTTEFYNSDNTLVAKGYTRIVVGDYGPYVEFNKHQVNLEQIKNRWTTNDLTKKIKYIWMQTQDTVRTKVFKQVDTVPYADYKVGRYYVDPSDLRTDDLEVLYDG